MKKLVVLMLALAVNGCAVHAHVDVGDGKKDRAAIDEVRALYLVQMQTGDFEQISDVFTEGVVLMPSGMANIEGRENAKEWLENSVGAGHPMMSFAVEELELAGDRAIERGTYWDGAGKRIWVYERSEGGEWRIKSMMWSANKTY